MVSFLEAIILGIVQGITEWLPVSSSGHLVMVQELFNIKASLLFDILLHVATAIVVLFYMRYEVVQMFKALIKLDFSSTYGKWLIYLALGTVITGLIGYFGYDYFSALFSNLRAVSIALMITGIFLLVIERFEKDGSLNLKHSLFAGLAQALAIVPGISRSGSTVGSMLLTGANRRDAAHFSFLLAVPAILGAAVFESRKLGAVSISLPEIVGVVVAMIVGYLSLKLFFKIILKKKLWIFGIYCLIVGGLLFLFI